VSLALALDLGTTTLEGRLYADGDSVCAEARVLNPQAVVGADVVRRLEAALAGEGPQLQRLLIDGIASLLDELLRQSGQPLSAIAAAAAAANPAITILLCGDDPRPLLFPPYRPSSTSGRYLDLSRFGVPLPVPLYLFPLVSGYIGGDLVAFLYGRADNNKQPGFYLDLGTNAEMALHSAAGWVATSVAAGPAFEGGGISCGMLAGSGAITDVWQDGDRLRLTVAGDGPPCGLSGSGLFAAVAAALEGGLLDRSGRITTPEEIGTNLSRYLATTGDGQSALRLYRDAASELLVTQQDIRAFQLAKGAVRAGVECLLQRAGVAAEEITHVEVTGNFGLSLRPELLKTVAMLPDVMVDKATCVPAGAIQGVDRLLTRSTGQADVQLLADQIKPYPLSGTPAFASAFLASLDF